MNQIEKKLEKLEDDMETLELKRNQRCSSEPKKNIIHDTKLIDFSKKSETIENTENLAKKESQESYSK